MDNPTTALAETASQMIRRTERPVFYNIRQLGRLLGPVNLTQSRDPADSRVSQIPPLNVAFRAPSYHRSYTP